MFFDSQLTQSLVVGATVGMAMFVTLYRQRSFREVHVYPVSKDHEVSLACKVVSETLSDEVQYLRLLWQIPLDVLELEQLVFAEVQ